MVPKPAGVYVERTLTFACPNTDICLDILQKVDEELSLEAEIYAEFKLDKLVFKVIGLEPNVQSAMVKLRDFLSLYTLQRADPKRGIESNVLTKYLKKTVPLDVLATVLRKSLGVTAEVKGSIIYANTDLESFLGIAKKVAEIQKQVEQKPLPSSLKKLVVAAMAIYNLGYREILEVLGKAHLIDENNNLREPWQRVLDELENVLNQEENSIIT